MGTSMIRKTGGALGASAALVALALGTNVPAASAAAYTKSIYEPKVNGASVEAWADVNTDCEGTFGCWTYVKLERLDNSPYMWLHGWSFKTGQWASPGWNRVEVPLDGAGCTSWRIVVDTYNDGPSNDSVSFERYGVGVELGGGVKRFHKSESRTAEICSYA